LRFSTTSGIRLLSVHRERLVGARTRPINELPTQLHEPWPDRQITGPVLTGPVPQQQITRRLTRTDPDRAGTDRRDMIRRTRELTATINHAIHMLALAKLSHDPKPASGHGARSLRQGIARRQDAGRPHPPPDEPFT
jgi:hypothetical protein